MEKYPRLQPLSRSYQLFGFIPWLLHFLQYSAGEDTYLNYLDLGKLLIKLPNCATILVRNNKHLKFKHIKEIVHHDYYIFRCTPDWHSDTSSKSYISWILLFGFVIPTSIIILSSLVTCSKIREVGCTSWHELYILFYSINNASKLSILQDLIINSIIASFRCGFQLHRMRCGVCHSKETEEPSS